MREDFHIHVIVKYLQIPQQMFFYVYKYEMHLSSLNLPSRPVSKGISYLRESFLC